MLPYTSFVSHHRFRLCWFHNRSCYRASLRCLPPGKLFEMVTVSRPIIRKPAKNWKFYFHRRPQLVILARSRSHLDTVPCHNSPTTLPLGHYNAQDPRICWCLDAVLHSFHSSAIHRGLPKKPPSDKSPFPCHSHNNSAFCWFCYTSEVTSPICQRISPNWRRWRLETTYGGNFASISNTNSLHSCSYHHT